MHPIAWSGLVYTPRMGNAPFESVVLVGDQRFRWDPAAGIDLSIPVGFGAGDPEAFGLPPPRIERLGFDAVSCSTVHDLNPHTTTHVEGPLHAGIDGPPIGRLLGRSHFLARLVTLRPIPRANGDRAIERAQIEAGLDREDPFIEAVIVRTLESPVRRWSGTHPPFFDPEAAAALAGMGVRILLVDLPSIDPENDRGVPAHRAFFEAGAPEEARAICELLRIPDEVEDRPYLLQLVPLPWDLDASPVRPLLHRLTPA